MSEETKKKLFKVSGVGIDTTPMNFPPVDRDNIYSYIYRASFWISVHFCPPLVSLTVKKT